MSNYVSPSRKLQTNPYQDQFYKIKSKRLENELEQLKKENALLSTKLHDTYVSQQLTKQENIQLHDQVYKLMGDSKNRSFEMTNRQITNRSRQSSQFAFISQYNSSDINNSFSKGGQIQRLLKQIRILKNQHDLECANLKEEVKKVQRKNQQLEELFEQNKKDNNCNSMNSTNKNIQLETEIQNLKKQLEKLKQENKNLKLQKNNYKNKLQLSQNQIQHLKGQIDRLKEINEKNIQKNILNNSKISIISQTNQNIKQTEPIKIIKEKQNNQEKYKNIEKQLSEKKRQIQKLKENIKKYQIKLEQTINHEKDNSLKEKKILERRLKNIEQQSMQKQAEFKQFLIKLKPLLSQQKRQFNEDGHSCRANLSLLQILLNKYKIQMF